MDKKCVVLCTTYARAKFEWKWFLSHYTDVIKKANSSNLSIELTSGFKVMFVVGPEEPKGLTCKVVSIDEFELRGLKNGRSNDNL